MPTYSGLQCIQSFSFIENTKRMSIRGFNILLQNTIFRSSIQSMQSPLKPMTRPSSEDTLLPRSESLVSVLCRKARANNLPCVNVAHRAERCWRSSPQRPLRNKSGCLHAFCQQLLTLPSDVQSSPPPTPTQISPDGAGGWVRRDRGLFCSSIFEYSFVFAVCNSLF